MNPELVQLIPKLHAIFGARYAKWRCEWRCGLELNTHGRMIDWYDLCESIGASSYHTSGEDGVLIPDPAFLPYGGYLRMTEETAWKVLSLGEIP
jgi:hypothetical protein